MIVTGVDERSRWWSAVLSVAVHWASLADSDDSVLTDVSTLEHLYAAVDNIPRQSHSSE